MINDFEKFIKSSSTKQRVTAYVDAVYNNSKADTPETVKVLEKNQIAALWDSFNTEAEIKIFNKYTKLSRNIQEYCNYLERLAVQFAGEMNQINGFCMLLDAYKRNIGLFNGIIQDASSDPGIKEKIANRILTSDWAGVSIPMDANGTFVIQAPLTNSEHSFSLFSVFKVWSERAAETLISAKSTIAAIREIMTEEKFIIKPARDEVNKFENHFNKVWAVFPQYGKMKLSDLINEGTLLNEAGAGFIYPSYKDTLINTEEKEATKAEMRKGVNDGE